MTSRLRIGVLCDPREENWPSMDLVGEMLLAEWKTTLAQEVDATEIDVSIPRLARRVPGVPNGLAFNADRIVARFFSYPGRALGERRRHRYFHVVDHSYAQLVHALPAARTGVFCHDLDAFRALLSPAIEPRPAWFRAMARVTLQGMQAASVIFHSTLAVRDELERNGLVSRSRLVHAPYGVSPEFVLDAPPNDEADAVLRRLEGRPFMFHVGSAIPRKRIDVLFEVFARLRAKNPELRLVQQGGALSASQREHAARLGITPYLVQPPKLSRLALATLYRKAQVVLLPSDAEGFGFPIIEALACGAVVVASDLPVLREVGGDAVTYCAPGDPVDWAEKIEAIGMKNMTVPRIEARVNQAALFTWARHGRTILNAYQALEGK
jgi:glycosyltransferase involved in cell wall biosynthesis